MKPKCLCLIVASLLLLGAAFQAKAQFLIIHEKPVHLRHVTGVVIDQAGSPIPAAKVELRAVVDHHVLASTITDAEGRFTFPRKRVSTLLELRTSCKNFQIVQYTISVRWIARGKIKIVLPVAV
jgi:hypothetical protein